MSIIKKKEMVRGKALTFPLGVKFLEYLVCRTSSNFLAVAWYPIKLSRFRINPLVMP